MKTFLSDTIKPIILLLTLAVTFIACDKDFVNVESDIRGVQNFNTSSKLFPFKTYNKKIGPVQTNGFPSNLLGIYNDPNYGATAASIVTQIVPEDLGPDFGDNPEIKSVKLYIPYFSTLTSTNDEGDSTYDLDSIFGETSQGFTLSIHKNDFYLRDLDPETNFEEGQAYYSNSYSSLNANDFEGQLLYSNTNFKPSSGEIVTTSTDPTTLEEVTERKVPGILLDLNNQQTGIQNTAIVPVDFWKNLILDNEGQAVLTNSNEFKNFFRGLVIKAAETTTNQGSMFMLNLDNAELVIEYENDVEDSEIYSLNFNGITFNSFENLSNFPVLIDGNQTDGDNQLFIKGFEGSMTVVELFNGTILDDNGAPQNALEYFKNREGKWLINEANLTFYVDQTAVDQTTEDDISISEPDRIILYDLENNAPIIDYFFDSTEDLSDPNNSRIIHAPKLIRDPDGKGIKYKFRITQHLNRILNGDSENIKLGLYVSSNVNLTGVSSIKGTDEDNDVRIVPQTSVIAPKGTVLYGNTSSVPENSKATLEIFYTESQN